MADKGERVLKKYHKKLFFEEDGEGPVSAGTAQTKLPAIKKKITKEERLKDRISLKDTISNVLDRHKDSKKGHILSELKPAIKKVDKELKENKLASIKKHLKRLKDKRGKVLPNYAKERNHERRLKMKAIEGITKQFNAIQNYQKKHKSEIIEQKEFAKRKFNKKQKSFLEGGIVSAS